MSAWLDYRLSDFLMYSPRVYHRLSHRRFGVDEVDQVLIAEDSHAGSFMLAVI